MPHLAKDFFWSAHPGYSRNSVFANPNPSNVSADLRPRGNDTTISAAQHLTNEGKDQIYAYYYVK